MSNLWTKVIGDKKEWRSMEARADALPRDYRIVYGRSSTTCGGSPPATAWTSWRCCGTCSGLFETSAAEGKPVLDVTGEDVAAFCDERLRGTPSWVDKGRMSLNRDVASRLGHAGARG